MTAKPVCPQIVVAQLGARMHYAVPVLLHRLGFLQQLFTDAYTGPGSWFQFIRWLPRSMHNGHLKRLSQRKADLPGDKVTAFNLLGLRRAFTLNQESGRNTRIADAYLQYDKIFYSKLIASDHLDSATGVYTFNRSGLELLEVAKKRGLYCLVEQFSASLRELTTVLAAERERWAGWETGIDTYWDETVWYPREQRIWDLADVIISPSEYVWTTLKKSGVPAHKITTIPYSISLQSYRGRVHSYDGTRPLRVLFVGNVSLRKGIPYFLEAAAKLGPKVIAARLVGPITIKPEKLAPYRNVVRADGQVSRAEVIDHYDWADVFVLPSLCEGSATVTYEAKACGLPVIATPNTGAWIQDGEDGLIVSIRDSEGLAEALNTFVKQPALVEQMSRAALERASQFSWEAYERRLGDLAISLHKESSNG